VIKPTRKTAEFMLFMRKTEHLKEIITRTVYRLNRKEEAD